MEIFDGYLRIAPEVFMRITNNRKGYEKHLNRLQKHSPKTGQVMLLKLTEKQFSDIYQIFFHSHFSFPGICAYT